MPLEISAWRRLSMVGCSMHTELQRGRFPDVAKSVVTLTQQLLLPGENSITNRLHCLSINVKNSLF
jgi:xanthine/uracil/vitamin C permease (AzgA family)